MNPLDDLFDDGLVKPAADVPREVAKSFFPGVGVASAILSNLTAQPDEAEIEREAIMDVLDPVHEAELSKIKAQAMLTDFLANDPVISTYDSDQVLDAYDQIAQLTPRVALQPAVMRGELRRLLQQQDTLEPFEASQLVGIEESLKSLREPTELPIAPVPQVPEKRD